MILSDLIPGLKEIYDCNPVNPSGCPSPVPTIAGAQTFTNVGDVLSGFLNITFFIAIFLSFYWLIWGAYQYILASGKKEELAKARSRITWALIGLGVVFMAYFVAKYAAEIFPPLKGGLPNPSGAPF